MMENAMKENKSKTSGFMTILRVITLGFLCAYAWEMGKIPPDGLNGFGTAVALSFFLFAPALYFLPTIEAALRSHSSLTSIALINVFLGWTLVGWVIAIAWACKNKTLVTVHIATPRGESSIARPSAYRKIATDTVETLAKLADLKDRGALTQEEFNQEKAKIIARK